MSLGAGLARVATGVVALALFGAATSIAAPLASAGTIIQASPTSGTIDVAGSLGFTDTLSTPGFSGVTFTTTGGSSDVIVSPGGAVSTAGTLPASSTPYTVSGTDSDGAAGDTGTWSYSLTVTPDTILQASPTSGTVDVAGSAGFTDTLSTTGFTGVTFMTTSSPSGVIVSSAGNVTTSGTLTASSTPYSVSGTDSDADGDMGTWSYALTVTSDVISQGSPTSGTTTTSASGTFSATLTATSGSAPITFATSTTGFSVVGTDELESTRALSASGSPYVVTGTDSDGHGDTGTWTYSLTVTPVAITQGSPTTGSTTESGSSTFSVILTATSGTAPISFATSTTGFSIVGTDELESTRALNASGSPYVVTGTDSDAYGDSGTWTYTLSVTASGGGGGGGSSGTNALIQTSAITATVPSALSGSFTSGPITVQGNSGSVVFVTTTTSSGLSVSSSGLISTTGPLSAGAYSVSGTDSDALGDTGTWTFSLTVTATPTLETVTFRANGGEGVMASESESAPTALSLNHFTWAEHTFVDWNTLANGKGQSYANGALFPFTATVNLFAQWKTGKAASRTITFASNGGSGVTASETESTPTAIRANRFTRSGYTFLDWNTAAKGTGAAFLPGATYAFKSSITLFAQWKKIPKKVPALNVVTFVANGGGGSMPKERHRTPTSLTPNRFARPGYTFLHWNTSANGSGVSFANESTYTFGASVTMYAQWKKIPIVVPPPPVPSGPQIGPFAAGSSTLSSLLESQLHALAIEVKTKGDTQISLIGFGDKLTAAEFNSGSENADIVLSRMRAQAVATYLESQLATLGFSGFSISISAAKFGKGDSGQGANAIVVASLS